MHVHGCDHGCVCQNEREKICPACEIRLLSPQGDVSKVLLERFLDVRPFSPIGESNK